MQLVPQFIAFLSILIFDIKKEDKQFIWYSIPFSRNKREIPDRAKNNSIVGNYIVSGC